MRDIIYGAVAHGADFARLCQELEFVPHELNNAETLVPFKPAAEIWDIAIRQTGDPLLALHLGEEMSPTILGMIGYLMQSSQTLYQAIISLCKYNALYSSMLKYSVEESDGHILLHYEPVILWQHQYPESARQSVEISMSGAVRLFRTLSGKKIWPLKVELAYHKRQLSEYERIFQSVICFDASRNTLTFRKSDLLLPVISYDKSLFAFFNEALEWKLKSLKGNELFSDKIKKIMLHDFKGCAPTIEIAASHLNITVRSLQRRLKEEQTSYRDIINDLKKELAISILGKKEFDVIEVAALLGYSDTSAFRKAFKKWTAPSI